MARTDVRPLSARSGERRIGDVPSEWNKAQRRQERTKNKRELTKIRVGVTDWDAAPLRVSYRRPYYW